MALHVLAGLFALYMLARHGRRALLFLAPSLLRVEPHAGAAPRTLAQVRAGEALEALGFVRLGAWRQVAPLGALDDWSDAWAAADAGVYADVAAAAPAAGAPVTFVSPFPDGAFVLTANHARLATRGPKVQAGGLPGAALDAALAAHRIAVERFAREHGSPAAPPELAARVAAARRFRAGPGRGELRRLTAMSFANACVALVLLATSVNLAARGVR
jgi:hypothetical protein